MVNGQVDALHAPAPSPEAAEGGTPDPIGDSRAACVPPSMYLLLLPSVHTPVPSPEAAEGGTPDPTGDSRAARVPPSMLLRLLPSVLTLRWGAPGGDPRGILRVCVPVVTWQGIV